MEKLIVEVAAPVSSDSPKQHQHNNDDQNRANETDATVTVTVAIAAEAAAEATEQKDHKDDDENEPERHGVTSGLGVEILASNFEASKQYSSAMSRRSFAVPRSMLLRDNC
jgi:hypothetical protein